MLLLMMMMLMISSRMEHSDSATLAVSQHHLPPSAPLPTVLQINLSTIQNVTGQLTLLFKFFPAKTSKTLFQTKKILFRCSILCTECTHWTIDAFAFAWHTWQFNNWCTLHYHGHTCPHFTTFAWPHLTIVRAAPFYNKGRGAGCASFL